MIFDNRLVQATINSLLVHLLLFGGLLLLQGKGAPQPGQSLQERAIQVSQIPPSLLKKYRSVGVRGGSKTFQMKTPPGSPVSKNKKTNQPSSASNPKNLSLKNLQAKIEDTNKQVAKSSEAKFPLKKKEIKAAENGLPLTALRSDQAVENFRRQERMRRDMVKGLGTQSTQAEILGRAGFNLHFEPPDGVPEDELNSTEKIFYSFQKRTFVTYVNSFMSTYQQMILNKPQIQSTLRNDKHLLTGKIDFDKEGNILRIKILRSSNSDDVHNLFEKTLKEIRSLPNPPDALVDGKDTFTIYYQLSVNY